MKAHGRKVQPVSRVYPHSGFSPALPVTEADMVLDMPTPASVLGCDPRCQMKGNKASRSTLRFLTQLWQCDSLG